METLPITLKATRSKTAQYVQALSNSSEFEMDDDDTRRFYSKLQDYSTGANGSLVIPFTLGSDKQTFKAVAVLY
jgi:hypothetical protein